MLDIASIAENVLQPLDHLRFVADVAFHDVDGVVENVVDRQRDGTVDRLDAFGRRRRLLGLQQLERVQGHRHVAGEDFEELQVAFAERPRLRGFRR